MTDFTPEVSPPAPRKDFPSQAKELGTLDQDNYSPYGVAAGMRPFKPSLFPSFTGGVTVGNVNQFTDYSEVTTGIRAARRKNYGEQAAVTPSGSIVIAEDNGQFVVRNPDITSAGRGSVVTEFPSYPKEGFPSPQRINRLVVSPADDKHLFVVFVPQEGRRNDLPQAVYFVNGTDEKSPTFVQIHSFVYEHVIDFAAGQDKEGSELVAAVSKKAESSNTALHIFDTKRQEITKVNSVTTVIAGEAGEFFYLDQSGKAYHLMKGGIEGASPTWQSELIFNPANITVNDSPLFLTKAPEGKVVVLTKKGHVFLVDPQRPEKNGLPGTHYQLPEKSETGRPLILCEAAATPNGKEGYVVMREGENAMNANFLLYKLYDLSPEPAPVESEVLSASHE